ncbi:MAG: adenosylcobalamin-dependent ribonucleoside-diphosphate reductase [Candidatus Aenigmarchaeota archaeon]|nr:adenosylcobalamin-dependent ribonucleoside-diphosphate reductase [Candidatus Aenigmarchaeota archaeon]
MAVTKVKKRDARLADFEKGKIVNAIFKAAKSVGGENMELANSLADKVIQLVEEKFAKEVPTVEQIQDIVEKVLIENGHAATAKAYIIYRKEREESRKAKEMLGVRDELKLTLNTIKVLKARYLLKDENGNVIESTGEMFRRVAKHLALVDILYHDHVFDKNKEQTVKELAELDGLPKKAAELGLNINNVKMLHRAYQRLNVRKQMKVSFSELVEILKNKQNEIMAKENEFYSLFTAFEFMPNSPTLMNSGAPLGQLSACFVLPVGDSLDTIFDALKYTAVIHQSGGGTGFSFSKLRPNGDVVKSTKGIASGPLSFMRVFDVATDVIKQGGKRRGANMGIMRIDHPDILDFITSKDSENRILTNFNISVGVTDKFMKALENDAEYDLCNPRTGVPFKRLFARQVWEMITYQAWKTGDPGVIFIDEVNKYNQTPQIGTIEATNPCGEQPLLPYESCNLGSINLSKMLKETKGASDVDWDKLAKTTKASVQFLDNVIDANSYPIKQIEFMTHANRKIGLGVMGFADMLIKMGIRYDSEEALKLGEKIMKFVTDAGHEMSVELARKRGNFPNFPGSVWDKKDSKYMRNATVTTIAPTGTISIISDCSSGIEPLFAVAFVRKNVLSGDELVDVNKLFEKYAREKGFYSDDIMREISMSGSVEHIDAVPKAAKELFKTAHDIEYEWHIRMQAAFQKYTDNAVSKTINMRNDAGIKDVENAYNLAYKLKCKGVTIYRDMSKAVQVIHIGDDKRKKAKLVKGDEEKKEMNESEEMCPVCKSKLFSAEGCYTCLSCGYSKCG